MNTDFSREMSSKLSLAIKHALQMTSLSLPFLISICVFGSESAGKGQTLRKDSLIKELQQSESWGDLVRAPSLFPEDATYKYAENSPALMEFVSDVTASVFETVYGRQFCQGLQDRIGSLVLVSHALGINEAGAQRVIDRCKDYAFDLNVKSPMDLVSLRGSLGRSVVFVSTKQELKLTGWTDCAFNLVYLVFNRSAFDSSGKTKGGLKDTSRKSGSRAARAELDELKRTIIHELAILYDAKARLDTYKLNGRLRFADEYEDRRKIRTCSVLPFLLSPEILIRGITARAFAVEQEVFAQMSGQNRTSLLRSSKCLASDFKDLPLQTSWIEEDFIFRLVSRDPQFYSLCHNSEPHLTELQTSKDLFDQLWVLDLIEYGSEPLCGYLKTPHLDFSGNTCSFGPRPRVGGGGGQVVVDP